MTSLSETKEQKAMTTPTTAKSSTRTRQFVLATIAFWLAMFGMAAAQTYSTSSDPLSVTPSPLTPGNPATVSGEGFEPGSDVVFILVDTGAGTETELVSVTVRDDGSFTVTLEVPADFSGEGHIMARGVATDGAQRILGGSEADGSLARTGSSPMPWIVGGTSAAALGSLLLVLARRRQERVAQTAG